MDMSNNCKQPLLVVIVEFDKGLSIGRGSLRPDDAHSTRTDAHSTAKEGGDVLLSD